jgi:uncharacterized protein (TIGR00730 family)
MTMLRRVVVIAANSELASPGELAQARRLGRLLAENGITVVTDGYGIGASGTLADAAIEAGGQAVGVVLRSTRHDLIHPELTERRMVDTTSELRREWGGLADGILGLAGGFQSLDAAFGAWSWADPARETPLGLIDESGYYTGLLRLASDEVVDRFVRESQRGLLAIDNRAEEVLRRVAEYRPPETRRHELREAEE